MNEKKFPHGEAPRQKDAALEDDTVEAITGGTKAKTSKDWIDDARDWVKQLYGENENKEEP